MATKMVSLTPGETLRRQLEMLIGLAEHELEVFYEANHLDDEERVDKNDIRTATHWLTANMDFIIADAEFDGRI